MPRWPQILPVALAAALFCLYVHTLAPGLTGGDGGELLAAACSRAAPHPPGYPSYILFAKPFLALPWGSAAQRLNLLSAAANAGAAALLLRALITLWRHSTGGLLAALCFALLDLSWRFATSADVFALNNLAVAAAMAQSAAMLCAPSAARARRSAVALAALLGLALGNHQTFLFLLPPLLWAVHRARAWSRAFFVTWALASLLPYALMPWLFDSNSPWGWGDLSHVTGLLRHVLRSEYGTLHLSSAAEGTPSGQFLRLLGLWAADLMHGSCGMVPAGLLALVALRRQLTPAQRHFALTWGGGGALYAVAFFLLADLPVDVPVHLEMQSRFWLQLHLICCALAGMGAQLGISHLALPPPVRGALPAGLAALLLLHNGAAGSSAPLNLFDQVGRTTLASLPQNAIVLCRGEHMFNPLRALQACEGLRPDVTVLSVELMHAPWYRQKVRRHDARLHYPGTLLREAASVNPPAFSLATFLRANLASGRPIFQCDHRSILTPQHRARYRLQQAGLCQQILPQAMPPTPPEGTSLAILRALQAAMPLPARPSSWEALMQAQIAPSAEALAPQLLVGAASQASTSAVPSLRQSIALLEGAARVHPLPPPSQKNLGIAYYRLFAATGEVAAKQKLQQTFSAWLAEQARQPPAQAESAQSRAAVAQLLAQLEP